jgi:hypothetical protein
VSLPLVTKGNEAKYMTRVGACSRSKPCVDIHAESFIGSDHIPDACSLLGSLSLLQALSIKKRVKYADTPEPVGP